MKSNLTTLCYIEQDEKYLMMHRVKKEKDINKDKWIGIGGHFEADESPEECLIREVKEETNLTLKSFQLRGVITFRSDKWQTEYMFLYTAEAFPEALGECDEGTLEWIEKKKVYDLPIWEGDKIFFYLLEENRAFFSLKLRYQGEALVEAVLDGENIMEKSYLIVSIEEQDFGCEGRPDGMEAMVDVVLQKTDGTKIRIEEKDKRLYELDIKEGDSVFWQDGRIYKADNSGIC
ncbi:MAG: 8-oxo-dGTP diphosphatase [Lachnospiraceae bacterium]|nr:8-oxo-dGTP diphosphatase [Lachnospiraceae bacterium]